MISGTQTGPMFGFEPQNRRMRVWGINIFALNDDGLISERWGQFDVLTMMQQLGVAPGPPMPEAPEEAPEYGDPGRAGQRPADRHRGEQERLPPHGRGGREQGQLRRRSRSSSTRTTSTTSRRPARRPGFAGVEAIFRMFRTGFPDVKFTIDQMIGEGDYVATLVHGEGTHTGQFVAFPPSGKHAVWRSVGFFRIKDGKIIEHWGIPDLLGLLIQIGVIPPPQAASAAGTVEAQV